MTVWVAALLAGWAWAGPLEVSPTGVLPVQLSLALAPQAAEAGRFEAIEAISQIPGAAQAAQAVVPVLPAAAMPAEAMPQAVAAALRGGDALAFYQAAERTGYFPPESDEHQLALLDEGAARAKAEDDFYQKLAERLSPKEARRRGGKLDYAAFGRALRARPGLSSNVFEHADAKREILRAAGYTRLRGRGKTSVTLEQASDARVGRAFDRVLAQYRRR